MTQKVSMLFPKGLSKAFTLSYDDGVEQDERLISLMEKYGVKGSFNINSERFAEEGTVYPEGRAHRRMTFEECRRVYASENAEVLCHGSMHKRLAMIPTQSVVAELLNDRIALEKEFGKIIRGLAYPYGSVNADVLSAARLCGFIFGRTTRSSRTLEPQTEDLLALSPTCHHDDPELFALAERFTDTKPKTYPFVFYVWGHAYEFEEKDNWDRIEELFKRVGGRPDVWYATNTELFEYEEAFKRLVFSGDGTRIYNPTVKTLFAETDSDVVCLPPDAEVKLGDAR